MNSSSYRLKTELNESSSIEGEIEFEWFPGLAVTQGRTCFPRIMVTIMIEKDDFPPDLRLKAASRDKFGKQKSARKKSAGLLTKTNDRGLAHSVVFAWSRGRCVHVPSMD